jgi:hypothetical protein
MLDAYIIDRIRRQREEQARQDGRVPLEIRMPDRPPMPQWEPPDGERSDTDRGVVDVDFTI